MDFKFQIDETEIPWPVGLHFVGQRAATNFYVFETISKILLENPNVSAIVETGTYGGALTMYLGLWGLRLGVPVHTFDIEPNVSRSVHHVLEKLGVQMHWLDVFSKEALTIVRDAMPTPGYLLLDGGDKQREFATYAPLIPVGSIVSVHDWGTEVHDLASGAMLEYFEPMNWLTYENRLATVRIIGWAEDHYKQTTDEDVAEINRKFRDTWIEVIGEGGNDERL